ncbi:acetylglutamate kinase [Formosa sp. PL04]|uniref:acetylglutamate kinase n=1 Tax=Formosa sp. PL04 TaxID=3081755 RepID=UPI002981CB92|nr:acetylglutamate kinase [Formosa sp. PL04]MDW5287437.1 acetylglutamate kinase [Formosa sp. PL04]
MKTLKVVKIGGNIIDYDTTLAVFLKQFATLEGPKILVHGGGKLATKMAKSMNIEVQMVDGRRITDADTLDIITMVYGGKINKNIIAQLQANNCNSVGFTGADGNTIVSEKRPVKTIDYGFVGDVTQVNTKVPKVLLENNITPVFCAITHDENGQLLNTNADTVTSELAIAFADLYQVELYYCFEKDGVLLDIDNPNSVIEHINTENYATLKAEGVITDGMLPKLDNCFYAISNHVFKVCLGKPEMLFNQKTKHTTIQA